MADIAIFRINYKSDFILTLNSDAGWLTPFCIKFWTGAPSQAYYAYYDGMSYTHCAPVDGEPTKLLVQFDDHHLPIGNLKFQIGYHFTVADFSTSVEDEVINQASVIIEVDDAPAQVMLDFNGETAPEIQFALPAYVNEAQRIANEQARIAAEEQRISNEEARIAAEQERQQNEQQRISREQQRIEQEQQRVNAEAERVSDFASLKTESEASTDAANDAAALANEKAQLADDKAALAQAAATLANAKAQLAADKAALAQAAATLANEKAALAQQKAEYAQEQGDAAKTEAETAHALNEEVRDDEEARDQAEQIRQQQEAARQQAEAQRVIDFNAQMQQQQTAYTNAEAARDTAFNEAEQQRDAKVDEKVADITTLQAQIGYFVCDTNADTAAKTIAATGYALTTGGNIRIKMTNANTADAVTLNINSTGAKALFYNGAQASSTNSWEAGEVIEVYYDGTQFMTSNSQGGKAEKIKYDNSQSGLAADNVQEALDEIDNGLVEDEKVIVQAFLLHKEKINEVEQNANQVPSIKEQLSEIKENANQVPFIEERLSNVEEDLESTDLVVAHALTKLNSVAENIGNGYKADYSEELEVIEIPKPTAITKMNIISSTLPASKDTVLDATIEFWDKNGNYFKKPITEFTVQGNSSARWGFQKLNFGFDIADGSKIKFGDWVPQDSFHLKANFIDSFRGARNIIAYHVWERQLNDRGWIAGRPWRKLADADITTAHGTGSLNEDFNSDAKGVPDGFAVKVYWNNDFYGLFTLQLKKHRDNYAMGKSKAKHIFIDGYLDQLFKGEDNINWTKFELRNPKGLKDIDGNKYDGDNPKELSNTDEFSATVKGYVNDLSNRCNAITSAEDLVAIIDKDYAIDYLLNVNYMGNDDVLTNNTMYCTWDGNLWFTLLYDSDQSFGLYWEGNSHSVNASRDVFGVNKATGTPMDKFFTWFKSDMDARYKELRDSGIFDVKNIIKELSDWVAMIGTDNFDAEFAKWNETPSYRDGSLTYTYSPQTGGFYDSIGTIEKWLKERTAFLDSYFNYNN